jgi:multidrug efflux system membrane fusion protein
MRFLFSYGLALVIIVLIGVWMASGTLVVPGNGPGNGEIPIMQAVGGNDAEMTEALETSGVTKPQDEHHEGPDPHLTIAEREAQTTGAEAPAQSVRIATYTMQAMPIEVPLRGKTKAKSVVSVVPETQGIARDIHVAKGQTVKAGDKICTIDPGTRQAAVNQAQAALDQAQTAFDTNAQLREKGLAPANSGLQLEAALKGAQAALDNAKAELARTEVKAPVAGVIQDPLATPGAMLAGGAPCATIVQLDPMLFTGSVPEARIAYAALGLKATIETITNQTAEGEVTYISSIADQATRSFAIEIEIPNPDGKILDGLTASAIVKVGTAPAHLLPQSVLTLDDEGVLGVRTVESSKVAFYPVTILKDTRDGVWVTGLPPRADVITIGQEFVQAGQVVNAGYGPSDGETTETASAAQEASHS